MNQLQAALLGEVAGQDLGSAPLFDEVALDEIGGPDEPVMPPGEAEVCQERLQALGPVGTG